MKIQNFNKLEPVDFHGTLVWSTENAYKIDDGLNIIWIPKSQVISMEKVKDRDYTFTIPEWLAIDKEII